MDSEMTKLLPGIIFLIFLACSCNKDEFPDEFSIIGGWIENTSDTGRIEIEFKNNNQVFLKAGSFEPTDTLKYRLEKKDELQLFQPEEYPEGIKTTHKLGYSQKDETLTIYGLSPLIPEAPEKTVFRRK
jgi:hypothetical protein